MLDKKSFFRQVTRHVQINTLHKKIYEKLTYTQSSQSIEAADLYGNGTAQIVSIWSVI